MSDVRVNRSVVVGGGSIVRGSVTNNANDSSQPTLEMWQTMFTLAVTHGNGTEMKRFLELQEALNASDVGKARSLWSGLRSFASSLVQRSANVAQIIATIDTLTS